MTCVGKRGKSQAAGRAQQTQGGLQGPSRAAGRQCGQLPPSAYGMG